MSKMEIIGEHLSCVVVKYPDLPAPYHAFRFDQEIPDDSCDAVDTYGISGFYPLVDISEESLRRQIEAFAIVEADEENEREL